MVFNDSSFEIFLNIGTNFGLIFIKNPLILPPEDPQRAILGPLGWSSDHPCPIILSLWDPLGAYGDPL